MYNIDSTSLYVHYKCDYQLSPYDITVSLIIFPILCFYSHDLFIPCNFIGNCQIVLLRAAVPSISTAMYQSMSHYSLTNRVCCQVFVSVNKLWYKHPYINEIITTIKNMNITINPQSFGGPFCNTCFPSSFPLPSGSH